MNSAASRSRTTNTLTKESFVNLLIRDRLSSSSKDAWPNPGEKLREWLEPNIFGSETTTFVHISAVERTTHNRDYRRQ